VVKVASGHCFCNLLQATSEMFGGLRFGAVFGAGRFTAGAALGDVGLGMMPSADRAWFKRL